MPYLSVLADFRNNVRSHARELKAIKILGECDKLRDDILPNVGVRLEDHDGKQTLCEYIVTVGCCFSNYVHLRLLGFSIPIACYIHYLSVWWFILLHLSIFQLWISTILDFIYRCYMCAPFVVWWMVRWYCNPSSVPCTFTTLMSAVTLEIGPCGTTLSHIAVKRVKEVTNYYLLLKFIPLLLWKQV
jgi:hypothetical protein